MDFVQFFHRLAGQDQVNPRVKPELGKDGQAAGGGVPPDLVELQGDPAVSSVSR